MRTIGEIERKLEVLRQAVKDLTPPPPKACKECGMSQLQFYSDDICLAGNDVGYIKARIEALEWVLEERKLLRGKY